MCNWVTMLYTGKLTEHCKPAIMEKNENHYIKKKRKEKEQTKTKASRGKKIIKIKEEINIIEIQKTIEKNQ